MRDAPCGASWIPSLFQNEVNVVKNPSVMAIAEALDRAEITGHDNLMLCPTGPGCKELKKLLAPCSMYLGKVIIDKAEYYQFWLYPKFGSVEQLLGLIESVASAIPEQKAVAQDPHVAM